MGTGRRQQPGGKKEALCSIERTLDIVGDRWTLLVLRQVLLYRHTRFADFVKVLGIAPNTLTSRLDTLVEAGILEKRPYRDDGARQRYEYHPTPAGEDLLAVLATLQQWGDNHVAPQGGPTALRRTAEGDRPVSVAFVDDAGRCVPRQDVVFVPSPAALTDRQV
ncbi:winged helix-turn-helix transcriptional regulator [Streptomyces variegatus]|uniref:winged helix-turn-helix transcriptional regulator n=1 Tax=Streptomyces variegatus TaxID=284040 RepID=UPI003C2CCEA2